MGAPPTLTATTINSLVASLGERLADPNNVFWTAAELQANVTEALRTWNAYAKHWRNRFTFQTVAGTAFYDLSQVTGTLIPYTVTDASVIESMEYTLLEPPTASSWTGTDQFVLDDMTLNLQRRRDQFLIETGAVVSIASQPIASDTITIPNSLIDVRRLSWSSTGNFFTPLWRTDETMLNSFSLQWDTTPGQPNYYSVSLRPPLVIQVAPTPQTSGTLSMLLVEAGAVLNGTGVVMGIPDDFTWIAKFGALADCFGIDGQASDPDRAAYCEKRYQAGIDLAKNASTVLQAQVNGIPIQPSTLFALDSINPTWQNGPNGPPQTIAFAGMNILALSPPPDQAYTISLDVVQNTPIGADTDPILLSFDVSDVILDYAQHLSALKMAGAEFMATMPHLGRFERLAEIYRARTGAQTITHQTMFRQATKQFKEIPMEMVR